MYSHRLRTSRKESSWEIDDDSHLLVGRSETPYHSRSRSQSQSQYNDPYSYSYSPEDRAHSRTSFAGTHARAGSSLSMLSNIEFPDVRVPTFVERFIKFKDGLRKSSTYKAKYVSPVSPDPQFRIDDSAVPTPVAKEFLRGGANIGRGEPVRTGGDATGAHAAISATASGSGSAI